MSDLIDRQMAIDALREKVFHNLTDEFYGAMQVMDELPSVQPMRKKGTWVSNDALFSGVPYHCDQCGERTLNTIMGKPRWNFCPMCGADMRGE